MLFYNTLILQLQYFLRHAPCPRCKNFFMTVMSLRRTVNVNRHFRVTLLTSTTVPTVLFRLGPERSGMIATKKSANQLPTRPHWNNLPVNHGSVSIQLQPLDRGGQTPPLQTTICVTATPTVTSYDYVSEVL